MISHKGVSSRRLKGSVLGIEGGDLNGIGGSGEVEGLT